MSIGGAPIGGLPVGGSQQPAGTTLPVLTALTPINVTGATAQMRYIRTPPP